MFSETPAAFMRDSYHTSAVFVLRTAVCFGVVHKFLHAVSTYLRIFSSQGKRRQCEECEEAAWVSSHSTLHLCADVHEAGTFVCSLGQGPGLPTGPSAANSPSSKSDYLGGHASLVARRTAHADVTSV